VNPALDPATHEHMATGHADSKFGVAPAEALALAREAAAAGVLAGFHVHAGSQLVDPRVHDEVLAVLAPLFDALPGEARELDLGGGFMVPGFPFAELAERVAAFTEPRGVSLWLEPGRALVATAGLLLTRVLHVKEGPRRHVVADAGMADLVRPALYGAKHPIRLVGGDGRPPASAPTDVDGPLCENGDRLGRDVELPTVAQGDLLAVGLAGAYGLAMGSHYASHTRAAEVAVDESGSRLVRRREALEALWIDEVDEGDSALRFDLGTP
jgi:diaminopimelate decarboxylase